jgi:hypothetical protein
MPLQNAFGDLALDTTVQTTNTRVSLLQQLLQPLQRIAQLLKPLGLVTNATGRLNVDINNITGGTIGTVTNITNLPTLANVTTVGTVSSITAGTITTVSNQTLIGGANAFAKMHDISRQGYNSSIRGRVS